MTKEIKDYIKVTLCYWTFMLSDGALRMLVLFYFHKLGFTTIQLASLFLLYEFAGVICNLIGGWLGSRFGLKITMTGGLFLQIIALQMLTFLDASWSVASAMWFTMVAQAISGIAKGLHSIGKRDKQSTLGILHPGLCTSL